MNMKYLIRIPLLIVALTCPIVLSGAASGTPAPSDQASSQDSSQSPEFKAAEEGAQRYIAAYNKGDAKTLAEFYAEDVDYIDKDGAEVKGRDAIQKLLADNFQANPGIKLDATIDEVKQLTPRCSRYPRHCYSYAERRSRRGHAGSGAKFKFRPDLAGGYFVSIGGY
jgi:SnoaL-like domain